MTKGRRWSSRSRICIGSFLLLLCNVVAATSNEVSTGTSSDVASVRFAATNATTSRESIASVSNDTSGNVAALDVDPSTNSKQGSIEGVQESPVRSENLDDHQPKRSTNATSAPQDEHVVRRSRLTNDLVQNPGKSSSAKTGAEGLSARLSRINDLTSASTKRPPDDDENSSPRSRAKVIAGVGEDSRCDHNGTDCEATSTRGSAEELLETKKKRLEDFDVKESHEPDIDDGDKEKLNVDGHVSLVNDTYVNHFYSTENGGGSGNGSLGKEGTKEIPVQDTADPKEQVEIVGDVKSGNALRIVLKDNETENQDVVGGEKDEAFQEDQMDRRSKDEKAEEKLDSESLSSQRLDNSSNESSSSESKVRDAEEKSLSSVGDGSSATMENITQSVESINNADEKLLNNNESINLMPKARNVGFSKINEFADADKKITVPTRGSEIVNEKISQSMPVNKNLRSELTIEQRPYPYLKTDKNSTGNSDGKEVNENEERRSAEEVAAYENTIGQNQSEKKLVITEPSVVIENSIQQAKPNLSADNVTGLDSRSRAESTPLPATTARIFGNNETVMPETSGVAGSAEAKVVKQEDSESENAVSIDAKEERKAIKGPSFDVTGNGITEVSPKASGDSPGKIEFTDGITGAVNVTESAGMFGTTANPETAPISPTTRIDVQTEEEESMLMQSGLNVSEGTTEFPATSGKKTFVSVTDDTTMVASTMTVNDEPIATLDDAKSTAENLVTESPGRSVKGIEFEGTSGFVASTMPTTTKIEFEFVGLTERPEEGRNTSASNQWSVLEGNTSTSGGVTSRTEESTIENETTTVESNEVTPTNVAETTTTTAEDVTDLSTDVVTSTTDENLGTTVEYNATEMSTIFASTLADQTISVDLTTMTETETSRSTESTVATTGSVFQNGTTSPDLRNETSSVLQNATTSSDLWNETSPIFQNTTTSPDLRNETSLIFQSTTTSPDQRNVTSPILQNATTNPDLRTETSQILQNDTMATSSGRPLTTATTLHVTGTTNLDGDTTTWVPTSRVDKAITSTTFVPSTRMSTSTVSTITTGKKADESTPDSPTVSPDEITSWVKIVIEGSWQDVCARLSELRQSLADILSTGTDKEVSPDQIILQQSPCQGVATPTPADDGLTSMLIYVVDGSGVYDEAATKMLPNLYYKVSHKSFSLTIHSFLLVQEADSRNAIAAVVISSVAFICLLLLAGLLYAVRHVAAKITAVGFLTFFVMRKRQTRFNYGERCRPVSLDAYSLDSVPACNSMRRKGAARSSKRSYGNPTFEDSSVIPSHPLNFAGLSSFCVDVSAINEEFTGIPQVSGKIDEIPPGAELMNRYANVVPLPETRVPLQRLNNDPLTEYINASYVRGPKNATKYYIACQAPMESTVTDFWRMVWEQQCKVIIMLTDLVENGVEKCAEYVPPSEVTDCHRLYGDYQVTLKKRETKEKYAISTLHLKNLENNTFREVFHIWYLWPVNGVQSDGAGLIAVLLEARALQRGGPGPIVVHCSPGTGRTGTLIALDLGIRQYEITRTVDVPRVVYTIRRDRAGAVQTKEQYAFIYKALNLYATKLAGGVLEST